jgi:hypothetical protein
MNEIDVYLENTKVGRMTGAAVQFNPARTGKTVQFMCSDGETLTVRDFEIKIRAITVDMRMMLDGPAGSVEHMLVSKGVPSYAQKDRVGNHDAMRYSWQVIGLKDMVDYEFIFDHNAFEPYDAGPGDVELLRHSARGFHAYETGAVSYSVGSGGAGGSVSFDEVTGLGYHSGGGGGGVASTVSGTSYGAGGGGGVWRAYE